MKLFLVDIIEDIEVAETVVTVAEDENKAIEKIKETYRDCFTDIRVLEIKDIDGYKIILEKM